MIWSQPSLRHPHRGSSTPYCVLQSFWNRRPKEVKPLLPRFGPTFCDSPRRSSPHPLAPYTGLSTHALLDKHPLPLTAIGVNIKACRKSILIQQHPLQSHRKLQPSMSILLELPHGCRAPLLKHDTLDCGDGHAWAQLSFILSMFQVLIYI